MTTAERSLPKPVFTDAEAGAKEFPDSTARRFNYYTPAEAQADPLRGRDRRGPARPAALPRPGLAVRVLRRPRRLPAGLDRRSRRGARTGPSRSASPARAARATTGRRTAGTSSATRTRSGSSPSTATTPTSCGSSTRTSMTARQAKAFDQWNRNWVRFVERNVGAWMHVDHGLGPVPVRQRQPAGAHQHAQQRDLGEQHAPDPVRPGPRAVQPDAERGDRGLRRRRAPGDLEQRPGLAGRPGDRRAAHRRSTTGARPSSPRTWSSSRWSASCSGASWCSTRRRATATSSPPRSSAPRSTTSPSGTCATPRRCSSCSPTTASSPTTTRRSCSSGCPTWVPRAIAAARTLQPLWSQPDAKPPRFEDGLDARQEPVQRHPVRPQPGHPEGAGPVTTFKTAESPFKSDNTASNHVRLHADEQPGRRGGGRRSWRPSRT